MSFYKYLKEHAEKDPSHPAIIEGDTTLSYGEFVFEIERFASALSKLELGANSKIGLLCLNQKEYLIAFFAALLKGVPVIPFNFMLKPED
nr:acyl--CoA ligase [Nitrospinota bacterium]